MVAKAKNVDLSTPCFVLFAGSPTASEGKDERSNVNPSLSAKLAKQGDVEKIRHLFVFDTTTRKLVCGACNKANVANEPFAT